MSTQEIERKIRLLREMQRMAEEAQAEADALKDEIKAYMGGGLEKGSPGACGAGHQNRDHPPLLHRMRKAPCLNADQSNRQRAYKATRSGCI